jgi:transcriptional regulator with XRE-family HTH domain
LDQKPTRIRRDFGRRSTWQQIGWIRIERKEYEVMRAGAVDWRDVLEEELQDPTFRAEWEASAPARAIANRLIQYRIEHGLTQTALARMLGMRQPAISRLEIGEHVPTLPTLIRIARTLGIEILIDITPRAQTDRWVSPETTRDAQVVERIESDAGYELLVAAR